MIKLQRHLGVLPLPPRWQRWSSSLDRTLGINTVISEWERIVASLRFQGRVPPEVWGTGLTPSEWRSQDTSNINALQLAAISNFKLVRSCLHARKRKEYSSRISSYSAAREDKLCAGTMHIGFQCLLNEYTDDTDLQ